MTQTTTTAAPPRRTAPAATPLAIQPDEIRLIGELKAVLCRMPAGISIVAREGALQVWVRRREGRSKLHPPGQRWMQAATIALPAAPGLQPWASQAERNANVLAQAQQQDCESAHA